jgi:hypothetical protein
MDWFLEFKKLLKLFGFLNFYFVGLGWFAICVDVALFFCKQLVPQLAKFKKKLEFNSPISFFLKKIVYK